MLLCLSFMELIAFLMNTILPVICLSVILTPIPPPIPSGKNFQEGEKSGEGMARKKSKRWGRKEGNEKIGDGEGKEEEMRRKKRRSYSYGSTAKTLCFNVKAESL